MRTVEIEVFKSRLSEFLHLAASGEVVLVTDGDRVVAELGPPTPGPAQEGVQSADAVGLGWLTPALVRSPEPPQRLPVASWDALAADLAQDREER